MSLRLASVLGLLVALTLPVACAPASIASITSFDGERAHRELAQFVALGPRVAGTKGGQRAREFIKRSLRESGLQLWVDRFTASTPVGPRVMENVIGVVKGSRTDIVVFSNHYDSKYFPDFEFVGANDGGSTTAILLEMARTLGPARDGATIWLCFFDGEEAFEEWSDTDGVYGSRHLVETLTAQGTLERIRALINIDMLGDCDLGVYMDPDAPGWLTDALWNTAGELHHQQDFLPVGMRITDDHVPFRRAGVPTINLIDFRYGGGVKEHERNWHTVNDTIELTCAQSLTTVGDVLIRALPVIEAHED